MNQKEEFRWIRNDIDISDIYERLPDPLKEIIAEAEEADRNGWEGALYVIQDNIENLSKALVPDVISYEEWHRLSDKFYPVENE